jgi:hypothetical protein
MRQHLSGWVMKPGQTSPARGMVEMFGGAIGSVSPMAAPTRTRARRAEVVAYRVTLNASPTFWS